MNGQGTYYYIDGGKYEGGWKNGKRSGKGNKRVKGLGVMNYSNGERYDGEWLENCRVGRGTE